MRQKKIKRMKQAARTEMVYLRQCACCGEIEEINVNDDLELHRAMMAGELIAMDKLQYQKILRKEV